MTEKSTQNAPAAAETDAEALKRSADRLADYVDLEDHPRLAKLIRRMREEAEAAGP